MREMSPIGQMVQSLIICVINHISPILHSIYRSITNTSTQGFGREGDEKVRYVNTRQLMSIRIVEM